MLTGLKVEYQYLKKESNDDYCMIDLVFWKNKKPEENLEIEESSKLEEDSKIEENLESKEPNDKEKEDIL